MAVRRGEEKADQGCAASPLIKEPVAKALSKAPFECKCGVICPGISHVPNTDFTLVCHADGREDSMDACLSVSSQTDTQVDHTE